MVHGDILHAGDGLRDLDGDVGQHLVLHATPDPGDDAHGGLDHRGHLAHGGLHVGGGHPCHLGVGGAHERERHRLIHDLHVLDRGDDASWDMINFNWSHYY